MAENNEAMNENGDEIKKAEFEKVSPEEQAMLDELEGGGESEASSSDEQSVMDELASEADGMSPEERAMLEDLESGPPPTAPSDDEQAMLQDLVDNPPEDPVMARQVELPPLDEDDTMEMPNEDINMDMILDIPVDIHVEVGQTQASIRDVLKLSSGSVIELDRLAGQPADIIVNGKLIGQGDVVIISENFGIRITKLVKPEKRVDAF